MTLTSTALVSASISNGKALWYLTRATGLVAFVLLTISVVMGIVATIGWASERWPRFLSQRMHRDLSLFCLAFIVLHVLSTVTDGYVDIGLSSAFLPFQTSYRPVWISFGALAFDLMLAVMITSALRRRIGYSSWRFVHWLAYVCWPIALIHSLGAGSDSSLPFVIALDVGCGAAVAAAVGCRLLAGGTLPVRHRLRGPAGSVVSGAGKRSR
jgi:DMSO/TMAO reductase YedYZ heme-binding membrane subunit